MQLRMVIAVPVQHLVGVVGLARTEMWSFPHMLVILHCNEAMH